ncbi:MAG TPA: CBS domain-containing protein [Candidatus Binataceae bacterium]|nr:CBS domain-containing protein [Candidatus Binataceae bacterium]
MTNDDDETRRVFDEEHPGAPEVESALANKTLADIVTKPPLVVETTDTLARVIRLMQEQRHGCAVAVEGGKLAGIFTERDILMKIVGHPINLDRTPVSAFMTRDPVTLPGDSNLAFALYQMVVEGYRHIPLVDDAGRPANVVSMRDLIEYLSESFSRELLTLPPHPRSHRFRSREGA